MIDQMEFNVLKRAQDLTKTTHSLDNFFDEKGIDIRQVRKNPEYYEELIMQYSRDCISQELYRESKERMEYEFNKLCEFHRRNEENLVEKFYNIAKSIIKEEMDHKHLEAK
ncbi:MAG: hypothetical protein J6F30_01550 [Cellulosilyticum sp.]|nr:hypothetical protein [Cellulosilyticum sp.]